MKAIQEKLDQLAEFETQATVLELDRQKLIDQVKVPAEVLSAQEEANRRRQEIEAQFWKRQKAAQEEAQLLLAEIKDPEMPPEFVAALDKARQHRADIRNELEAKIERDRQKMAAAKAEIDQQLTANVAEVYKQVEQRKLDINTEFEEKSAAVTENIEKLKEQIKSDTEKFGDTVKGKFFQAVFSKGRTTWTTDTLDNVFFALASLYSLLKEYGKPELIGRVESIIGDMTKARKVGKPSISIRKV